MEINLWERKAKMVTWMEEMIITKERKKNYYEENKKKRQTIVKLLCELRI